MPVRSSLKQGSLFHVYNRIIDRKAAFRDDEAYAYFIALLDHCRKYPIPLSQYTRKVILQSVVPEYTVDEIPIKIHAYCVMPNHFHLLVEQNIDNGISKFINRVCNSYSKAYNKRFKRKGPLWESRFKAKEITDDYSYLQVMRYIHLNPVKSSRLAIDEPSDYQYSSYQESIRPQSKDMICDHRFLHKLTNGPRGYQEFVESKVTVYEEAFIEDLVFEETG